VIEMAQTFAFELISPERVLFTGDVGAVIVPAFEGEMTVLPHHAPFMSALRAGIVTVDGTRRLYVRGGFVDVSAKGLTLLAEQAIPVEEINLEALASQIKDREEDLRDAKSEAARAKATLALDQLVTMRDVLRH
jgi:F-type H+-transporting ATPase subunit epsilon